MTRLCLTNSMDTTETLLQPIWIPRQVIIYHQMCPSLQIHPFTSCIISNQKSNFWVTIKSGNSGSAFFSRHTTMNNRNAVCLPGNFADSRAEVIQRVAGFREDYNFPSYTPLRIINNRMFQNLIQLTPFCVFPRLPQCAGKFFQTFKGFYFGLQLVFCACSCCLIDNFFFDFSQFIIRVVVNIFLLPIQSAIKAFFQPFDAPFQRLVDSGRRRCQASLQNLQGKTHIVAALIIHFSYLICTIHFFSNILCHGFI